ncbi:MAG: hypothetical protein M1838_000452 [Thelocarpon superellum]|nr:MAG: hypothetical protein M1838_000452 [Thelocarpon superellum]
MSAVPQKVLNWLYSVLTSVRTARPIEADRLLKSLHVTAHQDYHDINRTYEDVAHILARVPSLSPRTEVYTYENGASALLLLVSGTLPVSFRGTVYQFPIALWLPYTYPREAPMVYVTPTRSMVVRPGQHVGGDGRVYHPYLARWQDFWDKSTLSDFLDVLSSVFAKEPPVVSRSQQARPVYTSPTTAPPPPPPLPPELGPPQPPYQNHQNYGPAQPHPGAHSHSIASPIYHPPPNKGVSQPTEDLLSAPLTISPATLTSSAAPLPAPPIPPNPEKDALLDALGNTLYQHRLAAQNQAMTSTLPSLQAQHAALQRSLSAMQHEMHLLAQLSTTLESNERILTESIQRADAVMEEAKSRSVPNVDDVLVAPTVVGGQLYDVVAEERALGDTMFVLGRALDTGRVGLEVFLKVFPFSLSITNPSLSHPFLREMRK